MIEFEYDAKEKIDWLHAMPFFLVHVLAVVGAIFYPPTWGLVALATGLYLLRMWAIIVGYHRYFSHRTFKTSRVFQFILGLIGLSSAQKGPLWWAAHHRHHHRHSDQEPDLHSPTLKGFLWAHVGWILCAKYNDTRFDKIRDFAKYPELRFLDKHFVAIPIALGAGLWALGGTAVFVWGGLISTVFLWHGTFMINSLAHVFGTRRYETTDSSRNSLLLSLITLGEGWHNNHHFYPGTARQGFFWWEIDIGYYTLKALELVGVVWDVRGVPDRVKLQGRRGPDVDESDEALPKAA
ncbi:MAG: fatty acid desaturase [Thermoanaerobaculia bacterium]|nr:fatty acid desaturase [Thermoanaerobaculia bacterium]